MNVTDYLLDDKEAASICLRCLERDYTYGEVQAGVSVIANYLIETGCAKGDRVILVSDNSFFWVAAYLGILRAGLVCVPLPNDTSSADLAYILEHTGAAIAFVQTTHVRRYKEHFYRLHVVTDRIAPRVPRAASQASLDEITCQCPIVHAQSPVGPNDLAALMFTSGSTGKPRGVMVSHENIVANTESIVEYLRLTANDRIMTILPFHYCFGTSLLHTHLRVGGSLVIDSRFLYPEVVLQRMRETECTGFAGVPSHFQILLRRSSLRTKNFSTLRYVQQAGGHLAPAFVHELRQALPDTQIFLMYGQTEATARLAYLHPDLLDSKFGSIGQAIPGVKLSVLNPSGEEVGVGEVGEIVAEGKNITQGYWRCPEETARCFRNGRLYTGDLAKVDNDGYLYIVDRAKGFLKCGGRRISTRQLEERLLEFPLIQEAAVVGTEDDSLGEAVKAFVVPRAEDSVGLEDALFRHCRQRMPSEFVPKQIVILKALPKSGTGKVLKAQLRG